MIELAIGPRQGPSPDRNVLALSGTFSIDSPQGQVSARLSLLPLPPGSFGNRSLGCADPSGYPGPVDLDATFAYTATITTSDGVFVIAVGRDPPLQERRGQEPDLRLPAELSIRPRRPRSGAVRPAHTGQLVQPNEREHEARIAVHSLRPGHGPKGLRVCRRQGRGQRVADDQGGALPQRGRAARRIRDSQLRLQRARRHVRALGAAVPRATGTARTGRLLARNPIRDDQRIARFAWNSKPNARRFNVDAFADGSSEPFGSALADDQQLSIFAAGSY